MKLLAGRARLATTPAVTGSHSMALKTTGIVVVACFRVRVASGPLTRMTSGSDEPIRLRGQEGGPGDRPRF